MWFFCWREAGATGAARAGGTQDGASVSGAYLLSRETAIGGKNASHYVPPRPAEYWRAFEDIERASAPAMSDSESVSERLDVMHAKREPEVKEAWRQQLKWMKSKLHKATVPTDELKFHDKKKLYTRNAFVRTIADFDLDTLQNASIDYGPTPVPLEVYLNMINSVRQKRIGIQVEPVTASLPDPSVAYTPFHRDIARQKTMEKRFRVHYLTGSGRKFPYYYNADDDCFWKKVEDGTVACVLKEDLRKKPRHDPALAVAIDQTGMYDRIEEAPFPRTPLCADFYLEKATWTYYCVPDLQDLRLPKDYKKMQRYKNQLNKLHFHRWAVEESQRIDLPVLHRPPRPAGAPAFPERYVDLADFSLEKTETGPSKALAQEIKKSIRENHRPADATISAADVQYPMQEGVLIVTPGNYTVAAAPPLTAIENELLVAASKKFAKYSYDVYSIKRAAEGLGTATNSTTAPT